MDREAFEAHVEGGRLGGWVAGTGEPVLLLHGGPGLSCSYLDSLVPELADGYRVANYQQRGLAPSTARGPYDVPTQVADIVAVLDCLGWDRPLVLGHSWGGHLLLHLLAAHPERLRAALVVDTLGGVGDGGEQEFDAEMTRRIPPDNARLVEELDKRAMAGEASDAEMADGLRLAWPAYFADGGHVAPFPVISASEEAYAATFDSQHRELPGFASRLAGLKVPTLFLHGGGSPMPLTASTDTAAAIGDAATVEVVEGAGHFIWFERPGAVRAALDRIATA